MLIVPKQISNHLIKILTWPFGSSSLDQVSFFFLRLSFVWFVWFFVNKYLNIFWNFNCFWLFQLNLVFRYLLTLYSWIHRLKTSYSTCCFSPIFVGFCSTFHIGWECRRSSGVLFDFPSLLQAIHIYIVSVSSKCTVWRFHFFAVCFWIFLVSVSFLAKIC